MAHLPVVVLVGARQVGKTTLLRHLAPEAQLITFDPVQDVGAARQDPDRLLASYPGQLILDEIQYVPGLMAAVKRAIDRDRRPGRFLITGSQQWQVMTQLAESLAGRALILELDGFSLGEIEQTPGPWLDQWLNDPSPAPPMMALNAPSKPLLEQVWRGFLPEAQTLPQNLISDFHRSYLSTYIERDIRLLADITDWQLFGRFVRLLGALSGQEINQNQLGRELGIHPQTAKHWISMLSATYQWQELPPYNGNTIKRLSRKAKGYASDSGQACTALAIPTPQALLDHPALGHLVETALVGDLCRQARSMATQPACYHWRSHGGAEVDLLLAYNGKLHPIEIKATSHPGKNALRGIRAFRDTYPDHAQDKGLIIAPVEQAYQLDDWTWVVGPNLV
jgi:predicted AAA+ superfamily ATPase